MAHEQDTQPQDPNPTDDYTSSTKVRLRYLASGMSFVITLAFLGLIYAVAFGYASFGALGAMMSSVFVITVLAAVGWTFGLDLVERYLNARRSNSNSK